MAKLVIFDSGGRREVELVDRNSIGRHPQNQVQVLDRVVSKEHCMTLRPQAFEARPLHRFSSRE